MKFLVGVVSLLVVVGCQSTLAPVPDPEPDPTPALTVQQELLALHNQARDTPLELDDQLTEAAQDHADWMASRGRISHTGDDGSSPGRRITEAGYSWTTFGENVAWGQRTPDAVMSVWLSSRGHRRNIKSRAYLDLGVGVAKSRTGQLYWCTTFGSTQYNGEEWSNSWSVSEYEGGK